MRISRLCLETETGHPRIRRESEKIFRNPRFLAREAEPPEIRSQRDAGNEVIVWEMEILVPSLWLGMRISRLCLETETGYPRIRRESEMVLTERLFFNTGGRAS